MRRLLKSLVLTVFVLAIAALALVNRQAVTVDLPASDFLLVLPLWAVFFLGLLSGVLLAAIVTLRPRLVDLFARRDALRRAARAEARLAELDEARATERTAAALGAIEQAQRARP